LRIKHLEDHGTAIGAPHPAKHTSAPALVEGFDQLIGKGREGAHRETSCKSEDRLSVWSRPGAAAFPELEPERVAWEQA
jgi:hypothetical protein